VLAIAAGLVTVKLTTGAAPTASESPAPQSIVSQVTGVPPAVLDRVRGGGTATPLQTVKAPGPVLSIAGKPAIVFVGEESCPFCAAERWPLAVALSHFGTWSHLGSTRFSATDVFPSTATLSFRTASYRTSDLTLRTTDISPRNCSWSPGTGTPCFSRIARKRGSSAAMSSRTSTVPWTNPAL